jgi:8-oxo-dGTP pyrophosphatase MutT (NUDIX family)
MSGEALPTPDLAATLTAAERERSWPNQRPRDAATLIIIDRRQTQPRLLMGKRHSRAKFMPGKFVFPGGRMELADRHFPIGDALHPVVEAKLMKRVQRPSRRRARALAVAAIRETLEETGILLGQCAAEAASAGLSKPFKPSPAVPWHKFLAQNTGPCLNAIHLIARAITPPRRPRRFDARFFAIDAVYIAGQLEGIVGPEAELVELVWIGLLEAHRLDLPTITSVVLQELTTRLTNGMAYELPVPFYYEKNRHWIREEL